MATPKLKACRKAKVGSKVMADLRSKACSKVMAIQREMVDQKPKVG